MKKIITLTRVNGESIVIHDLPVTVTEFIGPEEAEKLLQTNPINRKLDFSVVDRYIHDLEEGLWDIYNGANIRIGIDGKFKDGQHRCVAIVKSGIGIPMQVTYGVSKNSNETTDNGKRRTLNEELDMRGYKSTSVLGAVVNKVFPYTHYNLWWGGEAGQPTYRRYTSIREALAFIDTDDYVVDITSFITGGNSDVKNFLPRSVYGLLVYLLLDNGYEWAEVEEFFAYLNAGEFLSASDPVHRLRILLEKRYNALKKVKRSPEELAALVIKAFNAYNTNTPMKHLSYKMFGLKAEKFPVLLSADEV